jgi:hypothetical protein
MSTIEELLERKSSGSGLGIRDLSAALTTRPLYPQKLALTSPTNGGRSVGIVRKTYQNILVVHLYINLIDDYVHFEHKYASVNALMYGMARGRHFILRKKPKWCLILRCDGGTAPY